MQQQCDGGVRAVVRDVLSLEECAELTFVHRTLGAAGYSPHLWTTKLSDVAYAEPALLLPLVAARDKVAAAAEAALGHPYELCIEFTGLVSWTAGARINWHYDSNRPYLEQRHATAVVYLNDAGSEFSGGNLQFQDGNLKQVSPSSGSMVTFLADESNTHRVTEVEHGERLTLTLWFTLLPEHSEDVKVLQLLAHADGFAGRERPFSIFQDLGEDIRMRRLQAAELAASFFHNPDGSQSDPVMLLAVGKGWHKCDCHSARTTAIQVGGSAVICDSIQQALLALAFAQWQSGELRPASCPTCFQQLLQRQRPQLEAYMQRLRQRLPAAAAEWRSAGLLYDTSPAL